MRRQADDARGGRRRSSQRAANAASQRFASEAAAAAQEPDAERRAQHRLALRASLSAVASASADRRSFAASPATAASRTQARDRSCGPAQCRCGRRRARSTASDTHRTSRGSICSSTRYCAGSYGAVVRAFQLDADREIVAPLAALIVRTARMPCAQMKRHVLHDLAVAPNQQMRGHLAGRRPPRNTDARRRQRVREQTIDPGPAELAGRQADAMHDDQIRRRVGRTLIEVRRWHLACARRAGRCRIDRRCSSHGVAWRSMFDIAACGRHNACLLKRIASPRVAKRRECALRDSGEFSRKLSVRIKRRNATEPNLLRRPADGRRRQSRCPRPAPITSRVSCACAKARR